MRFSQTLICDVSPDGKRFLLLKDAETASGDKLAQPELRIVLNWVEELKRLVPAKSGS